MPSGLDFLSGLSRYCCLLLGDDDTGKAQPLAAKLLTPNGWITMGDVQMGDTLLSPTGEHIAVLGVYPQGPKTVYKVTCNDGASTECCDDHLWLTQSKGQRGHGDPATVKATREIRESLDAYGKGHGGWWHSIPIPTGLNFTMERPLPIDPYVLGVLLGDGCFQRSSVSLSNPDTAVHQTVAGLLPEGIILRQWDIDEGCPTFGLSTERRLPGSNLIMNYLRGVDLAGNGSAEKFIPTEYQFSTVANRLALLQGLMDTDGTVDKRGVGWEYSTSSPQLAADVASLVRSLGGVAMSSSRIPRYTHKGELRTGQRSHRVFVILPPGMQPFRLSRKFDRCNRQEWPLRSIKQVEAIGEKECQCISVEGGLYITDDFIVTHNTRHALSFPVPYAASSDPAGLAIAKLDPRLRRNLELGWVEYLVPKDGDLQTFFDNSSASRKLPASQNLYAMLDDVHAKAKEERIQSFLYDPISYLSHMYFQKLMIYDKSKYTSPKTGNLDTQGMYGALNVWLRTFVIQSLLPLTQAGPHGLNVIVTCHLMRESEEKATTGGDSDNAKLPLNKGVDIKASILGGYRDHVTKPFGAALVLETDLRQVELKEKDANGKPVIEERKKFWCYCSKSTLKKSAGAAGFGEGVIQAKDKYGLLAKYGPRFSLNGVYLYDILEEIAASAAASSDGRKLSDAATTAATTTTESKEKVTHVK
jgi:hypothetical protein